MIALLGSTLAFTAFGVVLKVAGLKRQPPSVVAFVNYAFAAIVTLCLSASHPTGYQVAEVWLLGIVGGVGFVAGFYLNYRAINLAGLSVAQPVISMALAVPILASVAFWHETPSLVQSCAIAVACLSLLFLGSGSGEGRVAAGERGSAASTLLALFFVQGIVMTVPKALQAVGYGAHRWPYLAVLFSVAAVVSGVVWLRSGEHIGAMAAALGLCFGLANIAATALFLAALNSIPGIVAYPVSSVGSMVLGTSLGMLLWHERPAPRAMVGLALSVPAVLLLSI